ncbi:MAG: Hpt domain-containing protein, partial [Steroidobacteraceae bacterium]
MPAQVDLKEFLAGFLMETDEHLHAINSHLVAVAAAVKARQPEPRAVRELFRSLHTIKGLASMVGVEPVVDVSHEMESILRTADRAGGRLSEEALDLLVKATRFIEECVRLLSKRGIGAVPPAPAPLLEALALSQSPGSGSSPRATVQLALPDEVLRSLSTSDREQAVQAAQAGRRVVFMEFQPSTERAARGFNITAARGRLSRLGELVKVIPRSSPSAPTGIAFGLLLVTDAEDAVLAEAIDGTPEAVRTVAVTLADGALGAGATIEAVPGAESEPEWVRSDHSIRVDVRRLDEALEQLSALVVTRYRMTRVAAELGASGADTRELQGIIAESARQLRRLRAAITTARMVPLADLLQRLPLVVRGLTRDSGKSVNIDIQAGSAEVDKAVADRIFPAVVHLVRNAVDHGIETREERRRVGKPEAGSLSVRCDDSSGTNLLLEVRDDGRGIDRAAVSGKLGRAPARTDDELLQQIAMPGFS